MLVRLSELGAPPLRGTRRRIPALRRLEGAARLRDSHPLRPATPSRASSMTDARDPPGPYRASRTAGARSRIFRTFSSWAATTDRAAATPMCCAAFHLNRFFTWDASEFWLYIRFISIIVVSTQLCTNGQQSIAASSSDVARPRSRPPKRADPLSVGFLSQGDRPPYADHR